MSLAVYTTIHPGVLPFLDEWYASLCRQTDMGFELWVGIDQVRIGTARAALGPQVEANWVRSEPGDTPAQVRERAWQALIPQVNAVVMVDADDVMRPGRVEHARRQISGCDLGACGLQLIEKQGTKTDHVMPPEGYRTPQDALPRYNIFGLSNSVFRMQTLEEGLPLPEEVRLIDWYLATQAWLRGASLSFSQSVQMEYRQHDENTLSLLPPFSKEEIQKATRAVRCHFRSVLSTLPPDALEDRVAALGQAAERVQAFAQKASGDPGWLKYYTERLNRLSPDPLWWSCVAHPDLEYLWT